MRSAGLMQTLQRLSQGQAANDTATGSGARPKDGVVVPPLRGDFSLNAANALAASSLLKVEPDQICWNVLWAIPEYSVIFGHFLSEILVF